MCFAALSETQLYTIHCNNLIAKAHKLTSGSSRWNICNVRWQQQYKVEDHHEPGTEH